jgi:arylsulfatase A-like enzyme
MLRRRSVLRLAASAALAPFIGTATAEPNKPHWQPGKPRISLRRFGILAQSAERPNVVLIVTDDQDYASLQKMPKVRDLLERGGTAFSNAIVPTPSCSPSRASILRGQYTHNHGVWFNKPFGSPPDGGYPAFRGHEQSTLATWLQESGYRTALVGKYLNEYGSNPETARVPPGWHEWYALPRSSDYFDYDLIENRRVVHYGTEPKDYVTDVLSRKASSFVRRAAKSGKPFFLYLVPSAPHGPAIPAPRDQGKFGHARVPRTPAFNEEDVDDKPEYVRKSRRLGTNQIRQLDAHYRNRIRTLQAVDDMVADLVQTLRATGTFDNTYVFFTSDNGYLLGEHRRAEKALPYEEAIRVPLLVRGPGVPTRVEPRLASNIDLAPTIAALAGVEVPGFVDGRSLVPLLHDEDPPTWRQAVAIERAGPEEVEAADEVNAALEDIGTKPQNPPFRGLRTMDRVYVEYPRSNEQELYDLAAEADPAQLQNRAGDPDRANELDDLQAWSEALRSCAGASCRNVEDSPP